MLFIMYYWLYEFSRDCICVVGLHHLSIMQIMIEFCPGGAVDATMLGRPLSLFPVFPHLLTFLSVITASFDTNCCAFSSWLSFPKPRNLFIMAPGKSIKPRILSQMWFPPGCSLVLALTALDTVWEPPRPVCFYVVILHPHNCLRPCYS